MKKMHAELYSGGGWLPIASVHQDGAADALVTFQQVTEGESGADALEAEVTDLLRRVGGLEPLKPLTVRFADGQVVHTTASGLGHIRIGVRRELDA